MSVPDYNHVDVVATELFVDGEASEFWRATPVDENGTTEIERALAERTKCASDYLDVITNAHRRVIELEMELSRLGGAKR